ncbi:MAG: iron-containing alcohol dehydrogenase [Phycisphaerales bacterium]|nr:iron-containing alcohol dehydrogenase [Phycisphaerales bacterium]
MLPVPQPRPGRSRDFQITTKLVHGPGSLARLPEVLRELGAHSAVLVSDNALVKAGHVGHVMKLLEQAGLRVHVFADTCENPTDTDVQAAATAIKPWVTGKVPVAVVALGGGSVMDSAKAAMLLATVGGSMAVHRGWMKTANHELVLPPLVAIPTTAGTGSEVQSYALIREDQTHAKMACGLPQLCPAAAILDAELTVSCPPVATALAGLDALSHAMETAVCTARHDFSLALSQRAFQLIHGAFELVLAPPENLPARHDMLMGSCLAGLAIEHAMLGAAHALANPLSARFGVAHGRAVGMMLPGVIRFNAEDSEVAKTYAQLWPGHDAESLAQWVEHLLRVTRQPGSLGELGVTKADVPVLAEEALQQWTLRFNPRAMSAPQAAKMYQALMTH